MRTWYESLLERNTRLFIDVKTAPRADGFGKKELTILGFLHMNRLGTWDVFIDNGEEMEELGGRRELWEAQQLLQRTIKEREEARLAKALPS
ncbi:hypothetical protein GVN20_24795 [Runella sp. CRIBMP]|uniref:hypothetical protein n=1 Tax=Runella sp. CRIBMP TaxID=2683261 RepID=UPI001412E92D|nr:hypothetical protein [Runella sp. CRIBMP]NBB22596.1 hypothetical protein [Runella sp. CRIBMP]